MMAVKRYELNETQWEKISPLLPGKAGDPGRSAGDNRLFVNGCLWVLRSGAHWCDLPERDEPLQSWMPECFRPSPSLPQRVAPNTRDSPKGRRPVAPTVPAV